MMLRYAIGVELTVEHDEVVGESVGQLATKEVLGSCFGGRQETAYIYPY